MVGNWSWANPKKNKEKREEPAGLKEPTLGIRQQELRIKWTCLIRTVQHRSNISDQWFISV